MAEPRQYGSADDIFEAESPIKEVFVPEFGNKWFRVKGLTAAEREKYEEALGVYSKGGEIHSRTRDALARLVAMSLVDADGKRIFREHQVAKLGQAPAAGLSRIADVARPLSGLSQEDVEELTRDLGDDQDASSSSSSPTTSVAPSMSSSTEARVTELSPAAN